MCVCMCVCIWIKTGTCVFFSPFELVYLFLKASKSNYWNVINPQAFLERESLNAI